MKRKEMNFAYSAQGIMNLLASPYCSSICGIGDKPKKEKLDIGVPHTICGGSCGGSCGSSIVISNKKK